jgi:1-deoxy-D-xylulose-5-phosphate synthase
MRTYDTGLSCVRYPRDNVDERFAKDCPPFELGKARPLVTHESPDLAVLGYGVMALTAMDAADAIGSDATIDVYDARFAKPVDRDLIRSLLERNIPILTIEDHSIVGGFGAAVIAAAQEMKLDTRGITRIGLPEHWIYQGSRDEQLAEAGLDVDSVVRTMRKSMDRQAPEIVVSAQPFEISRRK